VCDVVVRKVSEKKKKVVEIFEDKEKSKQITT
jgi:hypothetical protein